MLNASSQTLLSVAVAAAATTGSADENDISLAKTGAMKWLEKQSKDEMSARMAMVANNDPGRKKFFDSAQKTNLS